MAVWKASLTWLKRILPLALSFFLVECLSALVLKPAELTCLGFGACWAFLLAGLVLLLPRTPGRICFGITYYISLAWALAQTGYYSIFGKMMWLSDVLYAGEGADYITDILGKFPALWWIGAVALLGLGVVIICFFPKTKKSFWWKLPGMIAAAIAVVMLFLLPELIFVKDLDIWGTRSEYGQSSSYRATYETMYDARKTYNICGIYQLTYRDIWVHTIYPLTPAYLAEKQEQTEQVEAFFDERETSGVNEMTGIYRGKNVVLVLMESMDDWMITREDTPTVCRLMEEGICFTDFYTPGYGTARTINSEFCMNTGIYLPTNGSYVFDYVTNDFNQSIASQATENGYTAEVFHYNDGAFYSRGVFEPAMGYRTYNSYSDYTNDKNLLYDEKLLFEIPELKKLFFREGQTLNTVITRSAHLSYVYNEVLSHYGLKQYPQYRGKYASQEEDCARLKAKLVDDFFARLLTELEAEGQLENTVIIGVTDHYTYGYKDTEELYDLSGVEQDLLLEKTPCFIWSADGPAMQVDKTLNTADLLPTVLNLMGFDSPYNYLGQDAFDPAYQGYALFPDGSWICDGVVYDSEAGIIVNNTGRKVTDSQLQEMAELTQKFIKISNYLLTTDYYDQN